MPRQHSDSHSAMSPVAPLRIRCWKACGVEYKWPSNVMIILSFLFWKNLCLHLSLRTLSVKHSKAVDSHSVISTSSPEPKAGCHHHTGHYNTFYPAKEDCICRISHLSTLTKFRTLLGSTELVNFDELYLCNHWELRRDFWRGGRIYPHVSPPKI